jgi:glycyl-tRNA synthetase
MANPPKKQSKADAVISLCARRGMLFPSAQIYGSPAGFFDFAGYGSQLKRNVEGYWWSQFIESRQDIVGLDGAIISPAAVWKASGHLENFNDPLVECTKCKHRFRADNLIEEQTGESVDGVSVGHLEQMLQKHNVHCPDCKGSLVFLQKFNLMFKVHVGANTGDDSEAYLRGETAQMIFVDFKTVAQTSRKTLPFGIAQTGKAFRNEISPRNFVFRCREFSQMEIEYFIHPDKLNDCPLLTPQLLEEEIEILTAKAQGESGKTHKHTIDEALKGGLVKTRWHAYWLAECHRFLRSIGISPTRLRAREHVKSELSHYSSETWDIEYEYPWGFKELLGIANRGNFDLSQHSKASGTDLSFFDEGTKTKVVPHVIEPSFGLERLVFTVLLDAYTENAAKDGETEGSTVTLKLSPKISPVHLAILPLMKKDGMADYAKKVYEQLRASLRCEYDESGSIGKRYARMDEVGTPYCATIDYDSLKDHTVTLRERDSCRQVRVNVAELEQTVNKLLQQKIEFTHAGKLIPA